MVKIEGLQNLNSTRSIRKTFRTYRGTQSGSAASRLPTTDRRFNRAPESDPCSIRVQSVAKNVFSDPWPRTSSPIRGSKHLPPPLAQNVCSDPWLKPSYPICGIGNGETLNVTASVRLQGQVRVRGPAHQEEEET